MTRSSESKKQQSIYLLAGKPRGFETVNKEVNCFLLDLGSAGEEKLSNGLVVIVEKLSILVSCFLCYQLEKPVFVSSLTWGRLEKRSFLQTHVIVEKLSILMCAL